MAKETIELSFTVDVAEFALNLPKTVALKVGGTANYAVENDVTYDVALSAGLTDKVTAKIITDVNENKFLEIKVVADKIETKLIGTVTVTPQDQAAVEIGIEVEANATPVPEPKPEQPEVEKPNIDDESDVPDDNSLFLKFVGITADQKIEVKERRNKIIYFKTNGDKYTVASAVEGKVSVLTAEEIAKEKNGNAYKVVKLKITGVAKSSDVKISITAEKGQDDPAVVETTLTVSTNAVSVEKNATSKVDITTNAANFSHEVTVGSEFIAVSAVEGGINITGTAAGNATVVIKATADGGQEKQETINVTVTEVAGA